MSLMVQRNSRTLFRAQAKRSGLSLSSSQIQQVILDQECFPSHTTEINVAGRQMRSIGRSVLHLHFTVTEIQHYYESSGAYQDLYHFSPKKGTVDNDGLFEKLCFEADDTRELLQFCKKC